MATAERSNNSKFHNKDDVVIVLRSMESTTSPITLGGIRLNTLTNDNAIIPIVYRFHSNLKNHDNFGSLSNSVDEEFEEGIKRLIVA